MEEIRLKAYAKINLGLDVLGKRQDGYHEVSMVMQNIDLYDKLTIRKTNDQNIRMITNLTYLPADDNNLVIRAAKLLMNEFNINCGLFVDLYKFIPVAAGMAGGSADAAAVIYGINKMFDLGLSTEELMERGVKLGADIPYCLLGGTALAEGIGEKLTKLTDCPHCYVVVAKPPFSVSTKFVYENLKIDANTVHPDIQGIIKAIENRDIYGVADRMENVLESVTVKAYPDIQTIKHIMKENGALNCLMSGSGPTVFGLFDDEDKAKKCNELIRKNRLVKVSYLTGICKGGFEGE